MICGSNYAGSEKALSLSHLINSMTKEEYNDSLKHQIPVKLNCVLEVRLTTWLGAGV
jgi:hypothetical protein